MPKNSNVHVVSNQANPITLDDLNASRFAIYAMLASNSYDDSERIIFDVSKIGWKLVDRISRKGGLAYDILKHADSGQTVWAFRGTDSKLDYITANLAFIPKGNLNQYKKANNQIDGFISQHGKDSLTVCGHSLGGGLALSVSVRHGVPAYVFNSSPRIFDGLGDDHKSALRISVYESGDALTKLRNIHPNYNNAVLPENTYITSYDFDGSQHSGDKLAYGLLQQGAKVSDDLKTLL